MSQLIAAVAGFVAGVLAALGAVAAISRRRRRTASGPAKPAASAAPQPSTKSTPSTASTKSTVPPRPPPPPGLAVRRPREEPVELGARAAAAPRGIPPPPPEFTGRAAELASLAGRADSGAPVLCVFGEGGSGRTALALRLCAELAPRFPDGSLRLDLGGAAGREPLGASEALARLVRALHPEARLPASEAALAAAWRAALEGRKVLVLLDDAAETAQLRPLLPPQGSLLVATSRSRLTLPGSFSRELAELDDADARALLAKLAPGMAPHAEAVVKYCAAQAFAVRLVGRSQSAPPETDPGDCLEALREAVEAAGRGAGAALRAACELAGAELVSFWSGLAAFPAGFDRQSAAAVARVAPDDAGRMLGELAARGLVEEEAPAGNGEGAGRWRLHELARAHAEERLGPAGRSEARLRHAVYCMTVLRRAEKLCAAGGESLGQGLALYDLEADNLAAAQLWVAAQAGADETVAHLCNDFPSAAPVCLALRLSARERIRWGEAALAAAQSLGIKAAEAAHLAKLGPACAELGEHGRALVHAERHLAAARAALDRGSEANALGLLASSAAALGEHRRAVAHYEEYLAAVRGLGNRKAETAALGNLGAELLLLGEAERAAAILEKQLAAAREAGDRRVEGAALANLSAAGAMLGDHRRAIALHEQLLAFAKAGGDRKLEAAALGRMAADHHSLGDLARAAECCEAQAAAAREAGDVRAELAALANLAAAFAKLGEGLKAAGAHDRHLAAARRAGDRRAEIAALAGLGLAWAALGEPRRAATFHEQHLELARATGDRRGEAAALGGLARALEALGEREAAAAKAAEARGILESLENP